MTDDVTQRMHHVLPYRAFWHLEAAGVLEAVRGPDGSLSDYRSEVWEILANAPGALVALIDTGVSGDHPYLAGRVEQIDLTGLPMRAPKSGSRDRPFEGMDAHFLKRLGLDALQPDDFSWLERFCDGVSESVPFDHGAPQSSNRFFSAHGTSCAGLVVASSDIGDGKAGNGSDAEGAPGSLVYAGVDPFSKLLSITTTFAPKPETLILAFLLAALRGAEVILVPRGISSEIMDDAEPGGPSPDGGRQTWRILRKVILTVSEHIPIVCAAGNDAESRLVPPAALAAENVGRNGIIAVGAISYEGIRSSYSSYGEGLTVVGPSDDGEMFNEDQARLDKADRFFPDYPFEETAQQAGVQEFTYAQSSILAIDVPGPFGFQDSSGAPSGPGESVTQASGSFTAFGGTSAAASIVAGVAALVQRAARERSGEPLSGPELRRVLVETTIKEDERLPHGNGKRVPLPDIVNARGSKQRLSFEEAFGAGVVNALAAVRAVRDST